MRNCDYLILGGGAAGTAAAAEIRRLDAAASIIMLAADGNLSCKRPAISKAQLEYVGRDSFSLLSTAAYEKLSVLRLPEKVLSMDTEGKTVTTDAEIYQYGKCIYALGGYPFVPPIPGIDKKNVFVLRNAADMRAFKRSALRGKEVVIIGGGVVGLEMACNMSRYGMQVTVLETMPRLMARLLDSNSSALLTELLPKLRILTGVSVTGICGDDYAEGICLGNGTFIPCDNVIVSCGQRADTRVAAAAGIPCGRGVTVNEYMETGARDVYACGDCAEWNGFNAALWTQALTEGKTAGANAAGEHISVTGIDSSLIMNHSSFGLFALGQLSSEPPLRCELIKREHTAFSINPKPDYSIEKRFYRENRLVGVCLLGNLSAMESLKQEYLQAQLNG